MSQSNKVCLPPWPFKLSVKCDPTSPPFQRNAPLHVRYLVSPITIGTLQNILHLLLTTSHIFICLLLSVPFLMLFVYKSYLITPPLPTRSISLPYDCTFSPLATKTPCLRKFQHIHTKHNNTHPPTFHARSSFKPFRLILFIIFTLYAIYSSLFLFFFPPPLNFRFSRTIYQFGPISCLFLRRRSG